MVSFDQDWDELPIAELRQLDAVCVRFEQALVQDPTTPMDGFMVGLAEPRQRLLVRELLRLDIEQRLARGLEPDPEEYASRFPQWAAELRGAAARTIAEYAHERPSSTAIGADTVRLDRTAENDTHTKAASPRPGADLWQEIQSQNLWTDLPEDGKLGHYRLLSVIGRGGMGVVFRAHDIRLNREVAIKLLSPEYSRERQARVRFLREAKAAAVVRHNHVVTIHAIEEFDGIAGLVMEVVEGTTLEEYLRTHGKLSVEEVVLLVYQIAQGLAAAHQQGLIHRDIKPANILLQQDDERGSGWRHFSPWTAKITDFGLAQVAAEVRITRSGLIAGTPQYMSPEQANGHELDARSDLFCLGSVMYAMTSGRAAFAADSPIAIVRQVADQPAPALRDITPETPGWLIAIIEKLMAKSPAERFQTAAKVAEVLGRHLDDLQRGGFQPDRSVTNSVANSLAGFAPTRQRWRVATWITLTGTAIVALGFGVAVWVDRERPEIRSAPIDQGAVIARPDADFDPSWHGWSVDAPPPAIVPFTPTEAKTHQEAWSKFLGVDVETENSIGMKFRFIPPGEFLMGSTEHEIEMELNSAKAKHLPPWVLEALPFEGPQHRVTLTKPFGLSKYEVTRGQFRQFVEATGYKTDVEKNGEGSGFKNGQHVEGPDYLWNTELGFKPPQTDDSPVVNVSWNDSAEFCKWLSEKEGVTYRLPWEAEWEFACRSGNEGQFCFGIEAALLHDYAWIGDGIGIGAARVGQRQANAFGLFDMHGNVWEFCQDWHAEYPSSAATDPTGPGSGTIRVGRGGTWSGYDKLCRSAYRSFGNKGAFSAGFRVARTWSREESRQAGEHRNGHWPKEQPAPAIAPFDAKQAILHQAAWAKHLGVEVETTNEIGMKFRTIPPGTFLMGTSGDELAKLSKEVKERVLPEWLSVQVASEIPQHHVTLTQPFAISIHEVTRGQFRQFVEATRYQTDAEQDGKGGLGWRNGALTKAPEFLWNTPLGFAEDQKDEHPVVNVSWNDAVAFCAWLSKNDEVAHRLPTEAEWEYACRAGSTARFSHGDDESRFLKSSTGTGVVQVARVGQQQPNAWGLFDLHGNVAEWCQDNMGSYSDTPAIDPTGPAEGPLHVLRSGMFYLHPLLRRSASRSNYLPAGRGMFGFRPVHTHSHN